MRAHGVGATFLCCVCVAVGLPVAAQGGTPEPAFAQDSLGDAPLPLADIHFVATVRTTKRSAVGAWAPWDTLEAFGTRAGPGLLNVLLDGEEVEMAFEDQQAPLHSVNVRSRPGSLRVVASFFRREQHGPDLAGDSLGTTTITSHVRIIEVTTVASRAALLQLAGLFAAAGFAVVLLSWAGVFGNCALLDDLGLYVPDGMFDEDHDHDHGHDRREVFVAIACPGRAAAKKARKKGAEEASALFVA